MYWHNFGQRYYRPNFSFCDKVGSILIGFVCCIFLVVCILSLRFAAFKRLRYIIFPFSVFYTFYIVYSLH